MVRSRILDFGLAVPVDAERITRTHVSVGTPAFMAPEQVEARADEDARTDVWGIAATLHAALSGRPPFAAEDPISQLVRITRDPPHALPSDVPSWLGEIVHKGLCKERSDRWQSASELATALREGARASVSRTTAVERPRTPRPARARTDAEPHELPPTRELLAQRAVPDAPPGTRSRPAPRPYGRVVAIGAVGVALFLLLAAATAVGIAVLYRERNDRSATPPAPAELPDGFVWHDGPSWRFATPAHWQPAPSSYTYTVLQLADPAALGDAPVQVAMTVEPHTGTAASYVDRRQRALGAAAHSRRDVSVGRVPGTEVEATFGMGGRTQRSLHRVVVWNGSAYALGCYGSELYFESARPLCRLVLDSFRVGE